MLAASLKRGFKRQKAYSQPSLDRGLLPSPTNAKNQLLDSSARKLLTLKESACGLCGLRAFRGGRAGETNGQERVKCGRFGPGRLTGEVRKNPREPAQGRGSSKKKTNRRTGWSCVLVVDGCYPDHSLFVLKRAC